MDINQFKTQFDSVAHFVDNLNTVTGCCKWPKNRGDLFAYSVQEIKRARVDEKYGYTEESLLEASFRAASRLADKMAKNNNLSVKNILIKTHQENSFYMLQTINNFVLESMLKPH